MGAMQSLYSSLFVLKILETFCFEEGKGERKKTKG
jgi:hypothetical protein